MANYIEDSLSNRIPCRGLQVKPNNDTIKISTRMLDGQYSIQQIGTDATTLQVSLTVLDKDEMNEICATCEPISIYHYTKKYTGIISSQAITWQQALIMGMWYQGTFELAVSEVVDR
jgi:hypothetical protein